MKRTLSLLLSVLLIVAMTPLGTFTASAATSGTTGDCTWTLDDKGNLTISGYGKMADYDSESNPSPWGTAITSVTIGNGVTNIGDFAFAYNNLTSVIIPKSVTSIGNKAFYFCSKLTSVAIPDSVLTIGDFAFYACSSLTSVIIPDSVLTIGDSTFNYCWNLARVTIGSSVTAINASTFKDCEKLGSVTIPDSVSEIGNYAFYGCKSLTSVTIGNSVTSIGSSAFYGCQNLVRVTIPDSVTKIGVGAFSNCKALKNANTYEGKFFILGHCLCGYSGNETEITIPDSVVVIEDQAFASTGLKSVTIPDSVIAISDEMFWSCANLTKVTIGNSVTTIGSKAFRYCSKLKNVTIPNSVNSICSGAFSDCTSLTSVTFSDSVTSIGGSAFSRCASLTSVVIPDSVSEIGSYAFAGCKGLTSVTIGNGVTEIGSGAFTDCNKMTRVAISDLVSWCQIEYLSGQSLGTPLLNGATLYLNGEMVTDVTIPNDMTTIGDYAFYNQNNLTSVTIPDSVTSIGSCAFSGCTSLTILTPCTASFVIAYANDNDLKHQELHTYSTWTTSEAPTCTVSGTERSVCECCENEETRVIPALGHDYTEVRVEPTKISTGYVGRLCSRCGDVCIDEILSATGIPGDLDGDDAVTDADAIHLLMYVYFPEDYPVVGDCDYDGDGTVTDDDAIYLLMYTFFPDDYPLTGERPSSHSAHNAPHGICLECNEVVDMDAAVDYYISTSSNANSGYFYTYYNGRVMAKYTLSTEFPYITIVTTYGGQIMINITMEYVSQLYQVGTSFSGMGFLSYDVKCNGNLVRSGKTTIEGYGGGMASVSAFVTLPAIEMCSFEIRFYDYYM